MEISATISPPIPVEGISMHSWTQFNNLPTNWSASGSSIEFAIISANGTLLNQAAMPASLPAPTASSVSQMKVFVTVYEPSINGGPVFASRYEFQGAVTSLTPAGTTQAATIAASTSPTTVELLPASQAGGLTLGFQDTAAAGQATVTYHSVTTTLLPTLNIDPATFLLVGDSAQVWQIDVPAIFDPLDGVELTFRYDDAGMTSEEESDLQVFHYKNGDFLGLGPARPGHRWERDPRSHPFILGFCTRQRSGGDCRHTRARLASRLVRTRTHGPGCTISP